MFVLILDNSDSNTNSSSNSNSDSYPPCDFTSIVNSNLNPTSNF